MYHFTPEPETDNEDEIALDDVSYLAEHGDTLLLSSLFSDDDSDDYDYPENADDFYDYEDSDDWDYEE